MSKVVYDTSSKIPFGVETQSHGKEKFSFASRNSQLIFLEKQKERFFFSNLIHIKQKGNFKLKKFNNLKIKRVIFEGIRCNLYQSESKEVELLN